MSSPPLAGVSKSSVARLEAEELPAAVRAWLVVLDRLGLTVALERPGPTSPDGAPTAGDGSSHGRGPATATTAGDAGTAAAAATAPAADQAAGAEAPGNGDAAEVVELDAYRDRAGRRFPAHRRTEPFRFTTYWWSRHAGDPLSAPNPPARWSGRRELVGGQAPRAAPTTSRASACTCARCSGPRNDSA